MPTLTYQPLSMLECLDVLRAAGVTRAAFFDGESPYVVPMSYQWEAQGTTPEVILIFPDEGRKADALRVCDRVCLEFELPGVGYVDVVLLEGRANLALWEEGRAMAVTVPAEDVSGRRFFLPQ